MKPSNWESMSGKEKKEMAIELLKNMRGQYIISQALGRAIEVMKSEKYLEVSNIEDMEMLREIFFIWQDDKKIRKELENERRINK